MVNKSIKLIATDFDGVLTDGCVYYSTGSDDEMKKVSFKDIMGISLATKNGYKVAVISGENNSIINKVVGRFDIQDVYMGIKDKRAIILDVIKKYSLKPEEVCFIGDDINDIGALSVVGFPVTVPTANFKVKEVPGIYITQANAGDGAFREIIDYLMCKDEN